MHTDSTMIKSKFICFGIPAVSLIILLYYLPSMNPLSNPTVLMFMVLHFLAEMFFVTLPSGFTLSLSFPFLVCLLITLGPVAAIWGFLPGFLAAEIIKRKNPFRIVYNISQISISLFIASLLIPDTTVLNLRTDLLLILLAVIVFDMASAALVALMISLAEQSSFLKTFLKSWLSDLSNTLPIYYVVGIIMAICFKSQGFLGILLVTIPVFGVFIMLNTKQELTFQKHRAKTDALTQLGNRNALETWMNREIPKIVSNNLDLSVIMIDLDDFKKVNDSYGHDTGDQVLKAVGQTIKSNVRNTDLAFRFGGEEFFIILPDTSLSVATQVAERIRLAIAKIIVEPEKKFSITCSLGLSFLTHRLINEQSDIPTELIRQADNAMYLAKQNGKNQLKVYV